MVKSSRSKLSTEIDLLRAPRVSLPIFNPDAVHPSWRTPTKSTSKAEPVTPPFANKGDNAKRALLLPLDKEAVHRGLLLSALHIASDFWKKPMDPDRKVNQQLIAVVANAVAKMYVEAYDKDYDLRGEHVYTTKRKDLRTTTHAKTVCMGIQRFSANQHDKRTKHHASQRGQIAT